jgi:phosphoesterase RecJ-like protein
LESTNKKEIFDALSGSPRNVVVVSHTSPDGDALGSALAMQSLLIGLGHCATVILPDSFPDYYAWLPGIDEAIIAEEYPEKVKTVIDAADLQIIVDMNALKRAQQLESLLKAVDVQRILIDHHIFPEDIFDLTFSDITASSTSELVYEFIDEFRPDLMNLSMAECIYTGIVTDTGNFFHGNLTARTFNITAKLIEKGVDVIRINQLVYNTFSENRLRLLGYSISERMRVLPDKKSAYIFLTADDLKRFGHTEGDTEGIVNYGLSLKGIHISVLFLEKPEFIKLSLRSEGDINVNLIASKYFNGGGHKNASGAHFYGSMEEAINVLLKALDEL